VIGFGKTVPVRTRIKIHFIAYYNSHIQSLSRHSDTIAINKICFYRQLLLSSNAGPKSDLVEPLGYINRVACGPKLFHSMSALLVVWSGLLWPSVWPTVHTTFCIRQIIRGGKLSWFLWIFANCKCFTIENFTWISAPYTNYTKHGTTWS